MRVLIVDDDPDQLFVRDLLLTEAGFQTMTASGREMAVKTARNQHPDCALVDLRLPDERTGLDLIGDLKSIDARMQIFVLTGANTDRLARNPESALIEEVIPKGLPSSRLIARLKKAEADEKSGGRKQGSPRQTSEIVR